MRGRTGTCPKCKAKVKIPEKSETDSVNEDDLLLGFDSDDSETHTSGPIEFICKGCNKLVRTPATAAGKKGKCPHCDAVVRIPRQSTAPRTDSSAKPEAKPSAPESIQFFCPSCQHSVSTPASAAGKMGQCPSCESKFRIPSSTSPAPEAKKKRKRAAIRESPDKPSKPAASGSIEFDCKSCGKLVRTPASVAGKKGKCPHCQALMDIPSESTPPKSESESNEKPSNAQPGSANEKGVAFDCPSCSKLVRTPPGSQGKKGKCPHCDLVLKIPSAS